MKIEGPWIGLALFVLLFIGMRVAMHVAKKHGGGR